ncbi:hypothetical protein BTH_II1777 [Burkholderia thailandensis E264]|uniref:Uncharacterized protein n=1 Tax=Burkholderia thailandensis (strain ATCC 700388 / DSM 13276 / CCUG 48851 / CIP 106301 / E264) TaxID=271848 RepID=Q2T4C8_BURTA|nr:hypothetical protein BTH_II1777 [Burkholderia thailandensis E264]
MKKCAIEPNASPASAKSPTAKQPMPAARIAAAAAPFGGAPDEAGSLVRDAAVGSLDTDD